MRARALLGSIWLLAWGCDAPPPDLARELPAPRLAALAPRANSVLRYEVAEGSEAHLGLGPRRGRANLRARELSGWVELDSDSRHVVAGEVRVELHSLEPSAEPGQAAVAAGLSSLLVAGQALVLRWPPTQSAALGDLEPSGSVRALMELNRHRSELSVPWAVSSHTTRAPSVATRGPVSVVFADHGLTLRLRAANGSETLVSDGSLRLDLALARSGPENPEPAHGAVPSSATP